MRTKATMMILGFFIAALAGVPSARADICGEYRTAIDALIVESAELGSLNDTLDAVREGMRAARTTRTALNTLKSEPARKILAAVDVSASDRLQKVEGASVAVIETLEDIYTSTKAVSDDLS